MPIREYQVKQGFSGCEVCKKPFERIERVGDSGISACPSCASGAFDICSTYRCIAKQF